MSRAARDAARTTLGSSNNERHSGHVDVAMSDPDCEFCNPAEARSTPAEALPPLPEFVDATSEKGRNELLGLMTERSTPAEPLDVERLRHALSLTKWWEHCGHIDSADGWTTPQLAEAILARIRSPEKDPPQMEE